MKTRSLALAATVLLATVTAAAAQTQQGTQQPNGQVATMPEEAAGRATRSDWFISPNDPRYQENGAPRAGQEPVHNTPYAPIQSDGPGGNGNG